MKYSDYFCQILKKLGYTHCFALQGGAIMHLINSANKFFTLVPFLHEHSAAIAAEYFNATENGKKAWVLVSSGPGLTNTVSAISGAFLESRELLIVGGQVKTKDLLLNKSLGMRQTGIQQNNGASIVKPITKFSKTFFKTQRYKIIKKYALETIKMRKGPVFLEIPIDVQAANIKKMNFYKIKKLSYTLPNNKISKKNYSKVIKLIKSSQRISILLGGGISRNLFKKIRNQLIKNDFAFFSTWNGAHLMPYNLKKNFGRPNTWGQRYSNIILQQSDLVIAAGTRLGLQQTGFNYESFISKGKIIHIDLDKKELNKKNPKTFLKLWSDANHFLSMLSKGVIKKNKEWIDFCEMVKKKIPVNETNNNYTGKNYISPYTFYEKISDLIPDNSNIIPCSSGGAYTTFMQTFKFKSNQICISNKGLASMGYGLAGAIGAAISRPNVKTFLFEGDGGFTQNLQEIGTVIANKLNLKIFIFSDKGYASIRQTQKNYFNGKYVGCDKKTGLIFPDWFSFFNIYELNAFNINKDFNKNKKFIKLFNKKGAAVFVVNIDPEQTYFPKISSTIDINGNLSSNPIHDMTPSLNENIKKQVFKYNKLL